MTSWGDVGRDVVTRVLDMIKSSWEKQWWRRGISSVDRDSASIRNSGWSSDALKCCFLVRAQMHQ